MCATSLSCLFLDQVRAPSVTLTHAQILWVPAALSSSGIFCFNDVCNGMPASQRRRRDQTTFASPIIYSTIIYTYPIRVWPFACNRNTPFVAASAEHVDSNAGADYDDDVAAVCAQRSLLARHSIRYLDGGSRCRRLRLFI